MYSDTGDTTSLVPGFPIRTSSDPRSVDSSPRHNAASHVLHRLPVPRHPPCALKHLQHKTKNESYKEIALTNEHQHRSPTPPPPQRRQEHHRQASAFRCSQPLSTNQTPHPTTKAGQQPEPPTTSQPTSTDPREPAPTPQRGEPAGLLPQDPTVCLAIPFPVRAFPTPPTACCLYNFMHQTRPHYRNRPSSRIAQVTELPHDAGGLKSRGAP